MPAPKYFVSLLRPEDHENTDITNERDVSVKDNDPAAMTTPCKTLYFRKQPRFRGSSSILRYWWTGMSAGGPFRFGWRRIVPKSAPRTIIPLTCARLSISPIFQAILSLLENSMKAPRLHCGEPFDGLATNDVGEWIPVLLHEGGLIPMDLRIKHLSYFIRQIEQVRSPKIRRSAAAPLHSVWFSLPNNRQNP